MNPLGIIIILLLVTALYYAIEAFVKIKKKIEESKWKEYEPKKDDNIEDPVVLSPSILSTEDLDTALYVARQFKRKWKLLLYYLGEKGKTVTYQFRNSDPYALRIAILDNNSAVASYYIDLKYNTSNGRFEFLSEGVYQNFVPVDQNTRV